MVDAAGEPIDGVIFDFHGTLVHGGDPGRWVEAALRRLAESGAEPPKVDDAEGLGAHLEQIWQHAHAFDPNSERDLSPHRHREVFRQAVGLYPGVGPDLAAALYAVMTDQWRAFDDTRTVLAALKARGVRVIVLSNVGIDIRPCLDRDGLTEFLDGVLLSAEVGLVKQGPVHGLGLVLRIAGH